MNSEFWKGKRVLVTGDNGFKGAWLAKWLDLMGAEVLGISLEPDSCSIYNQLKFTALHTSIVGDIRDLEFVLKEIKTFKPEIVFHLAAQALVREAEKRPVDTLSTNVMGTVNVLESLRQCEDSVRSIVVVTSDKVYKNIEMYDFYNEEADLGGDEPYSVSKVCEEMVAAVYRDMYFSKINVGVATARASNTFGGGDHHFDRLIPYLMKSAYEGDRVEIRNPLAIRPWQYILDLLRGYMMLAERLYINPTSYSEEWNFGPNKEELYTVGDMVDVLLGTQMKVVAKSFKEANLLMIDSTKSNERLKWKPIYSVQKGIECSKDMYFDFFRGGAIDDLMNKAIDSYCADLEVLG